MGLGRLECAVADGRKVEKNFQGFNLKPGIRIETDVANRVVTIYTGFSPDGACMLYAEQTTPPYDIHQEGVPDPSKIVLDFNDDDDELKFKTAIGCRYGDQVEIRSDFVMIDLPKCETWVGRRNATDLNRY